ncbi:hypothetical protein D3C87_1800840 [compost metagenome]
MDIKRIGVGNSKYPGINQSVIDPVAGYFTFDSTTVTFDSMVDTFDFDVIPIAPVVVRDYAEDDYSTTNYK